MSPMHSKPKDHTVILWWRHRKLCTTIDHPLSTVLKPFLIFYTQMPSWGSGVDKLYHLKAWQHGTSAQSLWPNGGAWCPSPSKLIMVIGGLDHFCTSKMCSHLMYGFATRGRLQIWHHISALMGLIWHGWVNSMPNFTPIGAMCHHCRVKNFKIVPSNRNAGVCASCVLLVKVKQKNKNT